MTTETRTPHFWKGLIAGLIGGLAGTAAKSAAESIFPPRVHGEPEPPEVLAEKVAGHHLALSTRNGAGTTIHWGFGALAGAAYGVAAEYYPASTERGGAAFGMALCAATHEGALPALGLAATPAEQTSREKSSEVATHVVYGVVTETVRNLLRRVL